MTSPSTKSSSWAWILRRSSELIALVVLLCISKSILNRRRLRADFSAFASDGGEDNISRKHLLDRQRLLRRRINAWYDIEQRLLPAVGELRARATYDTGNTSPEHLRLLLPSVIAHHSVLSDIVLNREYRLRQAQALDALADLRGHLEVLEYLCAGDCSSLDTSGHGPRLSAAVSAVKAEMHVTVGRYRQAYGALETLAHLLHKSSREDTLTALCDDDIVYVTTHDRSGKQSWIWTFGGTTYLPQEHLLDLHANKNLAQGKFLDSSRVKLSHMTFQPCESHGASLALGCCRSPLSARFLKLS